MQGILLLLYSKRDNLIYVNDIETQITKTGFGGICGNKGGVSIRMTYRGCAILLMNSHLAAHDRELNERIADYRQILDNHHTHVNKFREIFDHNCVLWFGDLNFRIQYSDEVSPEHIIKRAKKYDFPELFERDQLNIVRNQGKAFYQFEESAITFMPTFKFEEGTSVYSLKRRPAWTDRILWKLQNDKSFNITQLSYNSHPDFVLSDHKPVSGEFEIVIKHPDNLWQLTKVVFTFIPVWYLGNENIIEINYPENFQQNNSDWIGIYKKDFGSLSEYIAYEYTNVSGSPKIKLDPNDSAKKQITLILSEKMMVNGEIYVIIFFSNNFQRGISSIAGISNEFEARRECEIEVGSQRSLLRPQVCVLNRPKV